MRAWRLHTSDAGTEPRVDEIARPEPGPGQLLLRMRAAGLNRGELIGHGAHGHAAAAAPLALGGEAAGEVVAIGADVRGWHRGDRAMGRCRGAFADFVLLEAYEAMAVPLALDWPHAGALPLTFLVVYDMLVQQGRLRDGQTLLVAGITSGVGVAALQAAKAIGARVIGTSGSAAKLARLKQEGLDLGLQTRGADFVDAVREATGGRGADLAIDAVGGSVFAACLRSLAFEGRLAMVGYVDGVLKGEIDLEALHAKRLTVFGVSNKLRTPEQRAQTVRAFAADWLSLFAAGRLRPLVDQVHPFDALPRALDAMQHDEHVGKIVLAGSAD